jgi:hypothetical protein
MPRPAHLGMERALKVPSTFVPLPAFPTILPLPGVPPLLTPPGGVPLTLPVLATTSFDIGGPAYNILGIGLPLGLSQWGILSQNGATLLEADSVNSVEYGLW